MALSDPKQQLELIAKKTESAEDMGPRIVREIECSILFQYKWEELLMSGPVSIGCLGACFTAASSPSANVIFTPPMEGFKYLSDFGGRYGLKANLVRCTDLGRSAFVEADNGMSVINMSSERVYNIVDDIMESLASPRDAKSLPRQLERLGEYATTCYEAAKKTDLKFEEWLYHVCELHLACMAKQTSTGDKLIANDIKQTATQVSIDYQQVIVDQLEKTTKKLEKQLDVTTEAYKQASDEFPIGWDVVGQQIVAQLTDSLTTALNQAIPALVDSLNPIANAKEFAGLAGSLIHGNEREKPNEASSTNGDAGAPAADRHITSPAITRPKDADDPAYNQAARDLPFFELVNGVFIGDAGGINWDKAKGEPGKANLSIAFAAKMLQSSKTVFASLATSAEPSKMYSAALATACEIANGLKSELAKAEDIKYTLPPNESTMVQKWQSDFTSAFVALTGLNSTAKSFPGSPAGGAGVASSVDPVVQTAQINAKTVQAQILLDAGRNRLTTTRAALVATQDTYQKSTDLLTQQQTRFAELHANLERLKFANMTLSEIKVVLVQCIVLIVNLKAQITNMIRFFKAIATTVEFVVNKQVKPFITTMWANISDDAGSDTALKVGQYMMTDLQRSVIFNSTLMIRAYYSVFGDIAQMWMDLSRSNIIPGLGMLDALREAERDEFVTQRRAVELQNWSKRASDEIFAVAQSKRNRTLSDMKSRIATIAETTRLLPPPPKKIQEAIQSGVEHSKLAAEKGIEQQVEGSLVRKILGEKTS